MKRLLAGVLLLVIGYLALRRLQPGPIVARAHSSAATAPMAESATLGTKQSSNAFFNAPSLSHGGKSSKATPAQVRAAEETVLVLGEMGGLVSVSKKAFDDRRNKDQSLWEAARLSDYERSTNTTLRSREDSMIQRARELRIGMAEEEVVSLVGEPNKIYAPATTRLSKSGLSINGSVFFSRKALTGAEGDIFFYYTPHPSGRSFNRPGEWFKVIHVGVNQERKVFYLDMGTPHPSIWAE